MLAAWIAMGVGAWFLAGVVIGAILLDCGLRAAMVANQTLINSAVPDSRSRANTLFGLHIWGGNAVGAFLMSWTLAQFGWLAVCGVAMTAAARRAADPSGCPAGWKDGVRDVPGARETEPIPGPGGASRAGMAVCLQASAWRIMLQERPQLENPRRAWHTRRSAGQTAIHGEERSL